MMLRGLLLLTLSSSACGSRHHSPLPADASEEPAAVPPLTQRQLVAAILCNDLATLEQAEFSQLEEPFRGMTPMQIACSDSHVEPEVVAALLRLGATPNDHEAMRAAIMMRSRPKLRQLLNSYCGDGLNAPFGPRAVEPGQFLLNMATRDAEAFRLMLRVGAGAGSLWNYTDPLGRSTPMHVMLNAPTPQAALSMMRDLSHRPGLDLHAVDIFGRNVVHHLAGRSGMVHQAEMLDLLLAAGVDMDRQDVAGHTPLMLTIIHENRGMFDLLFGKLMTLDFTKQDMRMRTALGHARACINRECRAHCMRTLMGQGVNK